MQIISFKLKGKMAHFRKFYSNSSSLTYYIPPRTTIIGIIAGLLGYERDSYYEKFSLENCKVALKINNPCRKIVQKMNYLMIKSKNQLNGSAENHSQTAVEYLIPDNIREDYLEYQVWVYHTDKKIMENINKKIADDYYRSKGISFALGTAFNLGWIENVGVFEGNEKREGITDISSTVGVDKIEEIKSDRLIDSKYKIAKERVPLEFDKNREITEKGIGSFLFDLNGRSLPIKINQFVKLENGINISWLE